MLKVVEDVRVPISDKLLQLGLKNEAFIVRQRLVCRFVNEDEAKAWLEAYNYVMSLAHGRLEPLVKRQQKSPEEFDMLRSD